MANESLDKAVERLLTDARFLGRFRRSPERACEGLGLSRGGIAALKRGREDELLALGLEPALVRPPAQAVAPIQWWAVQNARRLPPAVLVAAALLSKPALDGDRTGSQNRNGRRREKS